MAQRDRTVGFDFGTTTTLVAMRRGEADPQFAMLGPTGPTMPSDAWVGQDGTVVAGVEALERPRTGLVRSLKRCITAGETKILRPDGTTVDVDATVVAVLRHASELARRGDPGYFDNASVQVGCPAIWRGDERRRLVTLANEAGLEVTIDDVLDEPVAAGIAWAWGHWTRHGDWPQGRLLVFDYGGGTLDVAVIHLGADAPDLSVLAAEGHSVAGDDMDRAVALALKEQLDGAGYAFPQEPDAVRAELELAGRRLKEALTFADTAEERPVGLPNAPIVRLTRTELDGIIAPQIEGAMTIVRRALRGAELRTQDVNFDPRSVDWAQLAPTVQWVLLSGGLSQVPAVAARLCERFPDARVVWDDVSGTAQETVAAGLSYGSAFRHLNLHRPPLAFKVRFSEISSGRQHSEVVYEAFEPLYSAEVAARGQTHLGVEKHLRVPADMRGHVEVELLAQSADGVETKFASKATGDRRIRGQAVAGQPVDFKLYVNGGLVFNVADRPVRLSVDRWPMLRSDDARLVVADVSSGDWTSGFVPGWWTGGKI